MGSNPILAAASGDRWRKLPGGGLAERSKAHAWKACRGATPSRVRTPQPPPQHRVNHLRFRQAVMSFFADDPVLEMPRGPHPWGQRVQGREDSYWKLVER
jgi:hypothetical protein